MNLNIFNTNNLFKAATNLFQQLNIKLNSTTNESLPIKEILNHYYKDNDTFKAIDKTFFIGIIDDSVFQATGLFDTNYSYKEAIEQGNKTYEGLMLFALELKKQPTRTEISELTRTFNRTSQKMPVALLLKYSPTSLLESKPSSPTSLLESKPSSPTSLLESKPSSPTSLLESKPSSPTSLLEKADSLISIAISERFKYLQNWRQGEKSGKVIILRDIHTQNTHAGHIKILQDLVKPVGVNTYEQLHQHWLQVLDVSILNKKFFQDLSNWYFTALNEVAFPDDKEKNKEIRNATNLIRLITRVIFIWFIKEKQLVPASLFRKDFIASILKNFNKNEKSQNYYNAILQNLFFGTLNQKMEERKFAKEGDINTNKEEYGVKNLFRYADLFNIPEKEVLTLFKDVPFLNGGLFDCLDKPNDEGKIEYVDGFSRNPKKQASVPDYIFFGEEKTVDLNEVYGTKNKRYTSRGLINLLESYKFTVAENTPIEEEIALDPELLGKVFENLLASYNPETQTTARKQTGSFYTPREIVNYMVDESLLEYIKQDVKNDSKDFETRLRDIISYSENPNPFSEAETKDLIKAINKCKILDPACGSGAFPMGILHKMVHILQKLDPDNEYWKELQRKKAIEETEAAFQIGDKEERAKRLAEINDVFENNASDYGRKLYLIENCIYGIDIQPIAVQIAKLRFFISLIIDQKVRPSSVMDEKENMGIRPLPNLETKFVAANTLIGLDKPKQNSLRNPDIEIKENELKELRHKYFTANTRKEKIALQKQDKKLRQEIAKMLQNDGWKTAVAKQIVSFDPYDQNNYANWFDPEWMFGLTTGFDIVIGNPPYIQMQKDAGLLADMYKNQNFETYERMGDIYSLFYEKGIHLLKISGVLTYITSNKWMRAGYGKSTRAFFCKHQPLALIDLGADVFESATVDTNILTIKKISQKNNNCSIRALDLTQEKNFSDFDTFADKWVNIPNLTDDSWTISSTLEQSIRAKIERIGTPLKDWDIQIYRGVLTGFNEAFIIDSDIKDRLIAEDPKSAEIIKPILRGRDIKRYKAEFADCWLINSHNGVKGKSARVNVIKDYPAIYKHLKQYEDKLIKRQDKGDHWTNLRNCAYLEEFEKEKIVYSEIVREAQFYYDKNNFYPEATSFIMTGVDLEYLITLLNSKFVTWSFKKYYAGGGLGKEGYRYKKAFLELLPIPKISKQKQQPLINLVNQILEKKENYQDTTALEKQIDELVYKLYELTEEEIAIIENSINKS